jgi:hypothetical protein
MEGVRRGGAPSSFSVYSEEQKKRGAGISSFFLFFLFLELVAQNEKYISPLYRSDGYWLGPSMVANFATSEAASPCRKMLPSTVLAHARTRAQRCTA